ncbi:MAG TPA: tRNA adenosine(34) deaminase TadA [Gammaproteobacteria bacterium]|nr:tRNA adenosine(34) deaminase TadA [Gammaproteobacteria bacterium]
MFTLNDEMWMKQAIQLAKTAALNQEVPVGAVLVLDHQVIGEGWNQPIQAHDPSAHAEIIALREGAAKIQNYRTVNAALYVTLEPCIMCVGAIVHARLKRVVYGAADPKTGAVSSVFHLGEEKQFNHRVEYAGGLLAEECGELLRNFFRERR